MKNLLIVLIGCMLLTSCKKESVTTVTDTTTSLHTISFVITSSNCNNIYLKFGFRSDTALIVADTTLTYKVSVPCNPSIYAYGSNNLSPAPLTSLYISIYWDNNVLKQISYSGYLNSIETYYIGSEIFK